MKKFLTKKINLAPHPRFFRMLAHLVDQPPQRLSTIQYAGIGVLDYEDMWPLIKEDLGLPQDTYICDGVRACDSIPRRASLTKHGVLKKTTHKACVIADWQKCEVMAALEERGIGLPPDYEMFGRSFDGLDMRFIQPIKENYPQDFAKIKKWFPFVDSDIDRWEHYDMAIKHEKTDYKNRAKNDVDRYKLAVNGNYWLCFSFSDKANKQKFDALFEQGKNGYLFADTYKCEKPTTKQRKARPRPIRLNTPPASIVDNLREDDGTLNDQARATAELLERAFEAVDVAKETDSVFGSNIYSVVICKSEQELKQFINDYHVGNIEIPYVDGDKYLQKVS